MDPLTELAIRYRTDKGTYHGFTRFYHKLFCEKRESIQKVLEVGIFQGASLFMWRDYFQNATVYGIDYNVTDLVKGKDRIVTGQADQGNVNELKEVMKTWGMPLFDLIIDDGGHYVSQQRITFETYWQQVAPGGVYIVEDLHTNILENYPDHRPSFVNESTTMHKYLVKMMTHGTTELPIPMEEIEDIIYFSSVHSKSLTCAIFKKKV